MPEDVPGGGLRGEERVGDGKCTSVACHNHVLHEIRPFPALHCQFVSAARTRNRRRYFGSFPAQPSQPPLTCDEDDALGRDRVRRIHPKPHHDCQGPHHRSYPKEGVAHQRILPSAGGCRADRAGQFLSALRDSAGGGALAGPTGRNAARWHLLCLEGEFGGKTVSVAGGGGEARE